jgi:hypothetical protein
MYVARADTTGSKHSNSQGLASVVRKILTGNFGPVSIFSLLTGARASGMTAIPAMTMLSLKSPRNP